MAILPICPFLYLESKTHVYALSATLLLISVSPLLFAHLMLLSTHNPLNLLLLIPVLLAPFFIALSFAFFENFFSEKMCKQHCGVPLDMLFVDAENIKEVCNSNQTLRGIPMYFLCAAGITLNAIWVGSNTLWEYLGPPFSPFPSAMFGISIAFIAGFAGPSLGYNLKRLYSFWKETGEAIRERAQIDIEWDRGAAERREIEIQERAARRAQREAERNQREAERNQREAERRIAEIQRDLAERNERRVAAMMAGIDIYANMGKDLSEVEKAAQQEKKDQANAYLLGMSRNVYGIHSTTTAQNTNNDASAVEEKEGTIQSDNLSPTQNTLSTAQQKTQDSPAFPLYALPPELVRSIGASADFFPPAQKVVRSDTEAQRQEKLNHMWASIMAGKKTTQNCLDLLQTQIVERDFEIFEHARETAKHALEKKAQAREQQLAALLVAHQSEEAEEAARMQTLRTRVLELENPEEQAILHEEIQNLADTFRIATHARQGELEMLQNELEAQKEDAEKQAHEAIIEISKELKENREAREHILVQEENLKRLYTRWFAEGHPLTLHEAAYTSMEQAAPTAATAGGSV